MHCILHRQKVAEYVCPYCDNLLLCETCKQEHANAERHSPENCKEVGLALMRQRIENTSGKLQTEELTRGLMGVMKELEAGLLREIDRFQASLAQNEDVSKMRGLEREGRYAELYFYVRGLPVVAAKSEGEVQDIRKRLTKMVDTASDGLKALRDKAAATTAVPQYKPMFATYKEDEVLFFDKLLCGYDDSKMVSALHSAAEGMSNKVKAAFITSSIINEYRLTIEIASILRTNPVSALYYSGSQISDDCAELLANALLDMKSLSVFCLNTVFVSDRGVKAVAVAARCCPSLTTFFLQGGMVSNSGVKAMTELMKGCPLSAFGFMSGGISDEGETALADMISSCSSTLSAFSLKEPKISDAGIKKMADAARNCHLLSAFYLGCNPLSGEMLAYVLEAVTGASSSIRLVSLYIAGEQLDSCLMKLEKSWIGRQLQLQLLCNNESVCVACATKWSGKFSGLKISPHDWPGFIEEVVLGTRK